MLKKHHEFILNRNLRLRTKERKITIKTLSKKTGIPLQTIHGWLGGVSPKNITQVKKVATFFGTTIDELCFKEQEN
ncbi:hypothetical protein DOM21_17380 [Bacteriovorax stolpii]|uniref:helix-turn-helix domain-containing protein n=1 Tax=Bacteriovorax stolpii TaxID=960 RepID=UPI0011585473|nr:helix-turn-helix transcriptional regulator [Bacteriovorax stolpii]QDK43195.1 hypothetical protein DOM21_17380 [Bacteriovorax stolpii]